MSPASRRRCCSFFAPGTPREGYFEGPAEFAISGPPSDAELADFHLRHDNVWL